MGTGWVSALDKETVQDRETAQDKETAQEQEVNLLCRFGRHRRSRWHSNTFLRSNYVLYGIDCMSKCPKDTDYC
jgi:hypothetical protein